MMSRRWEVTKGLPKTQHLALRREGRQDHYTVEFPSDFSSALTVVESSVKFLGSAGGPHFDPHMATVEMSFFLVKFPEVFRC